MHIAGGTFCTTVNGLEGVMFRSLRGNEVSIWENKVFT